MQVRDVMNWTKAFLRNHMSLRMCRMLQMRLEEDCISHCQRMQSACNMTEYKRQTRPLLAKVIHWDLCNKYGVKVHSASGTTMCRNPR